MEILKVSLGSLHEGNHTGDVTFRKVSAPGNHAVLLVRGKDVSSCSCRC